MLSTLVLLILILLAALAVLLVMGLALVGIVGLVTLAVVAWVVHHRDREERIRSDATIQRWNGTKPATWREVAIVLAGLAAIPCARGGEPAQHWAFVPPKRPEVPAVGDEGWVRNPIDAFILAALEAEGLTPSPEADRATLLRRLSFDLTGLPPSPRELDEFLGDPAPDAYEKAVDRLLASPHHGERWAQHWLDLARYADSDGFEFDQARPDAWRFRDWVVNALNADMPYDRFVFLQLAGDEEAPGDPGAFIATGFNRCYPDMVDLNDQGLRRQNALNDITETVGLAFLGLTIGCARCHDHKFDPITQEDFYRLQAFFAPARFRDDYPIASPEERANHEAMRAAWEAEMASVRASWIALEAEAREAIAPGPPPGLDDPTAEAIATAPGDRTPEQVRLAFDALAGDPRVTSSALEMGLGPARFGATIALADRLKRLMDHPPPSLPRARGLDEAGPEAPPTFLLKRGEFTEKGPEVAPGFPEFLDGSSPRINLSQASSGRRRALAEWVTGTNHPLTARVMVNRLWQHHFGRGLVGTSSDFGVMGDEPSHPALLDWLASEAIARGWSLKAMHRLIVTSASYRQASRPVPGAMAVDPGNLLLWRQNRRRLDGEAIRDALLAVSGTLNRSLGGPCVFPDLPPELTKLSGKGTAWPVSSRPEDRRRRSLYVFVRRNLRFPFFEAFDRPDTNASCPRRAVTTTAPQALSLLNGSFSVASARALSARVLREAGPVPSERVNHLYRLALGRSPDAEERRLAIDFAVEGGPGAWVNLALALLNVNEFVYLD